MDESSFDALAAEAAAELKGDRELYLEISSELRTHLEDKAAHFAQAGHDDAESSALAKKSFGSPLDMAAELLDANRGRLRLRALLRLACSALLIPLAIVLALYLGYGRLARVAWMQAVMLKMGMLASESSPPQPIKLPTLPGYGISDDPWQQATGDAYLLREDHGLPANR